ncbi:cysteine--tRNA ligase [Chlamydiifrater volucris]|uniref:cysteine--tRNA ligase n=1 Tax=Chlamydiifrater volucris TaxID=2681470 RepID=UPI001BD06365|nr:cysteine--tRNA ligase [Chlamydiifrater volucris]
MKEFSTSDAPLLLHNTLSGKKEPFSCSKKEVLLYTCGPTVYDYAHIGNFRTYVFEDILKRTLKYFGYKVNHVMNITDVDDKTIRRATEKKEPLSIYTQKYIDAFLQDVDWLGIERANMYPKATDYISEMISLINSLLEKGIAYVGSDQSVYYSVSKFPPYGKLSHLKLEELSSSTPMESDEYEKDHVGDFALWKAYNEERDGNVYWESPWGKGRPGWHIECSAMAMHGLGETLDIHAGGVDNIFPHHENEIAQSESVTGKTFSRFWMHSEHLLVNGKKMSKSLGNFFTLRDLLEKGYRGKEIRFLLLQSHYRMQLNFTDDSLEGCCSALRRLEAFVDRLNAIPETTNTSKVVQDSVKKALNKFMIAFTTAIGNDLNIAVGIAALFELVKETNELMHSEGIFYQDAQAILAALIRINSVLNILSMEPKKTPIPEEVLSLAKKRTEARRNKNWQLADALRDQITLLGYEIKDTKEGPELTFLGK